MKKLFSMILLTMALLLLPSAVYAGCTHEWYYNQYYTLSTIKTEGKGQRECVKCDKTEYYTIPKLTWAGTYSAKNGAQAYTTYSFSAKNSVQYQGREVIRVYVPADSYVQFSVKDAKNTSSMFLYNNTAFSGDYVSVSTYYGALKYLKKGTYYLLIYRSDSRDSTTGKYRHSSASLKLAVNYASKNSKNLEDGKTVASYVAEGTTNYHKLTIPGNGYIKLKASDDLIYQESVSPGYVDTYNNSSKIALYTATKKKLTDAFDTYGSNGTMFVAVKKGTYYIGVTGSDRSFCYHLNYTFTSSTKVNSTPSTAYSLSVGTAKVTTVFTDTKLPSFNIGNYYGFSGCLVYKITLTSSKRIAWRGGDASIYRSNGTYYSNAYDSDTGTYYSDQVLPAGTYYLLKYVGSYDYVSSQKTKGSVYFMKRIQ